MPEYREKLWPTPWIYIVTLLLVPASILVLAPVSLPAGIATGIILYLAAVGSLSLTAPVIEVRDRMLRAGRATISLDQTGEAVAAFDAAARVERGTGLDARASASKAATASPVWSSEIVARPARSIRSRTSMTGAVRLSEPAVAR